MGSKPIVKTKVAHVRMYVNGCVMKCQGVADLVDGHNTILVDCLAYGTDEESIRVRTPSTVSLLSVATTHIDSPQKSDAQSRFDKLKQEISRLETRIQNRTRQKELWTNCLHSSGKQDNLSDVADYLERLPKYLDTLDDELANLQIELDQLQKERDDINKDLREVRLRESRGLLQLRIRSNGVTRIPLEIELRSTRASWKPVYDVIVDDFSTSPCLRLRAEVSQNTGIDWKGVGLTLSTATPLLGKSQPHLTPLRLRKYVDRPRPYTNPKMMLPSMAAPTMSSMDAPKKTSDVQDGAETFDFSTLGEAPTPRATVNELVNSVEYLVPDTWDVSKDGEAALVEVQTTTIDASYVWRAVPSLDDSVYIVAILKDALVPEARGREASIYLEGEYCGKVMLDARDGSDSHEISLGADARMHTMRHLVTRKAATTFIRGRFQEVYTYELEVQNGRSEAVDVVLLDQVPISEEDEIAVQLGDCNGARHDEETGELCWDFNVPGHEAIGRRFSYMVAYPKGLKVEQRHDSLMKARGHATCPSCGSPVAGDSVFCAICGVALR